MRTLALLTLLAACNGTKDPTTDGTADSHTGGGDTSAGGYCAVQRVLTNNCVSCHSASGHAGGLDLQTDPHAALVGVASSAYYGRTLVVAGDSAGSFLTVKMQGTQSGSEGTIMPPSGPVAAGDLAAVIAWIDAGATTACGADTGGTIDTSGGRYHPEGYDDAALHGMDAKYQRDACVSCHGTDLNGGSVGVSCDACHDAGWRTDCTFCHGGTDNTTGAPPVDIDNQTTDLAFAVHTAHVTEGDHPAYDCVQCHVKPADVTASGHFLNADATAGVAEVDFHAGVSGSGSYSSGSCTTSYCHGNGQSSNGTVTDTSTVSCGSCHAVKSSGESAIDRMSGEHHTHVWDKGYGCENCHASVVAAGDTIVGPTHHVDGTVDIQLVDGMTWSGSTCTGTCHGERHSGRHW